MTPHPLTVLAASLAALAATWALTARADEAPVMVSSEIVMRARAALQGEGTGDA